MESGDQANEKHSPSSPNYADAKKKLVEYQRNLEDAKKQAASPPKSTSSPDSTKNPQTKSEQKPSNGSNNAALSNSTPIASNREGLFQVPIKYRAEGTAVIDVTFNEAQTYEMIVDTGASGTVITQKMATSLGVIPEGTTTADTPSAKGVEFSVGKVDSIEAGGLIVKNVQVSIAPQLDLGLLGHDFFNNYDITIKKYVVEFRSRSTGIASS